MLLVFISRYWFSITPWLYAEGVRQFEPGAAPQVTLSDDSQTLKALAKMKR